MKDSQNYTERSMASCMAPLWEKGSYDLREEIKAMSGAVLAFEPGTHWMYGYSSELAAGLIEAICDKPANDVFADILFKPLGMTDTAPHFFGDIKERMVCLYAEKPDGTFELTNTDMDLKHDPDPKYRAGNPRLFSTGRDYSRLMSMLANGGELDGVRIMGRKTIDLMRTNTLNEQQLIDFTDEYDKGYGYGYEFVHCSINHRVTIMALLVLLAGLADLAHGVRQIPKMEFLSYLCRIFFLH